MLRAAIARAAGDRDAAWAAAAPRTAAARLASNPLRTVVTPAGARAPPTAGEAIELTEDSERPRRRRRRERKYAQLQKT
jgi:hypothetical protein